MKRILPALAAIAVLAGATSLASADVYVVVPNTSTYGTVPSTGTYDQNDALNPVPIITNPSGEGGGVQDPGTYSGYVPAQ